MHDLYYKINYLIPNIQIKNVILLLVVNLLLTTSCGSTMQYANNIDMNIVGEVIDEYNTDASWNNYYSVVKVQNGNISGNGVIWKIDEEKHNIVIVTASHVLQNETKDIEITFYDGEKVNSSNCVCDINRDVAFIIVDAQNLSNEKTTYYKEVQRIEDSELKAGDIVYAVDFEGMISDYSIDVGEDKLELKLGIVNNPWIYIDDFGQYMIYLMMDVKPGMSGGGLYDENEKLIGILCGADGEGNAAAVPLSVIIAADISQNF